MNISQAVDGNDPSWTSSTLIVMDTDLERDIELAPQWPFRALASDEAHVTGSLLRAIGVEPNKGEKIRIRINLDTAFTGISGFDSASLNGTNASSLNPLAGLLDGLPSNQTITFPTAAIGLLPPEAQDFIKTNLGVTSWYP